MDANYSVLLVDMDFRRPTIHDYFGLSPQSGLCDFFDGKKSISDILIHPGLEALVILPTGGSLVRSSDLLSTPKMIELANELKHRYPDRIVVIDLPPLLQTDDAMIFMPNVDACLLVVAEGENTVDDVQKSIQLIDETKFMGTILNKSVEENLPDYYY
jgi:Mrp family chromosome partitioning ATPase